MRGAGPQRLLGESMIVESSSIGQNEAASLSMRDFRGKARVLRLQPHAALLGLTLCILPLNETKAQSFNEGQVVYEAGRNKIGLMRYCRDNKLLDPALADQAITAMENGLRAPPSSNTFDKEQGERAQKAGEAGFWDIGRRRDIASVTKLFRTTPTDLCREWAGDTLRGQEAKPDKPITATAGVEPVQPAPPAKPTSAEAPLLPTPAVKRAADFNLLPPLPERTPFSPGKARLSSVQRGAPASVPNPAATGSITPGPMGKVPTAAPRLTPRSRKQAARERTATAAAPASRPDSQPRPLWEKWLAGRPDKRQRCWMPDCRWRTSR